MAHMCALITIAMQLTCVVDKEIVCTNNEYLAQLLVVCVCFLIKILPSHNSTDLI